MEERLQKILAAAGVCSRRHAEKLIKAGRVSVDGRIVKELGAKADPRLQNVEFDGKPLPSPGPVYLLLNKPKGYVTTMKDPQGRPTVTVLLKEVKERVFPVGRLDLDTEGALLLTNDGELTQRILHPSNEINRTYEARVSGKPDRQKISGLEKGVVVDGRKTWPAKIKILKSDNYSTLLEIIIHEGRKRQVRKMCDAIGHPVLELKRTAYGALQLGNLATGSYRKLTQKELKKLFE